MTQSRRYANFLETLSLNSLDELDNYVTNDVHFIDPFFDIVGSSKLKSVFRHMFEKTRRVNFTVDNILENERETVILWTFSAQVLGSISTFSGVSHIKFSAEGLVSEHFDYWDPGKNIFVKIPIVGRLLQFVYRRAAKLAKT
ncbi:MAG: hypothetical protein CMM44_06600 [Rhodospirillaceae bacterium]|nr:hypothetical protein [Rhodospirillaceae bacterium]